MSTTTRRAFLGATAATAAAVLASPVRGSAANGTLKLGVIGVGGFGMIDAQAALKAGGTEIAAVCDVDSEHLAHSADDLAKLQGRRPRTFKLYQDLLDTKGLDAVIIATPPHWHALQFLAALDKGLDVYCEKPLAYDVREGRAMVELARRTGRIVQIGFQRRQSKAFQQVKQFIESGAAGRIVQVDAQINYWAGTTDATPQIPPSSLDWDLWCGPGPKIPYSPQVGHVNWRLEKTVGHGHLVDWGIHWIDACRTILGLDMPRRITAAGGLYYLKDKITTPDTLNVCFEFDRLPIVWRHRIWGAEEYDPQTSNGIFFYGDKATIFATDTDWIVIPKGKRESRRQAKASGDLGRDHMAEFLQAIRTRKQPSCRVEDAYRSTTTVQLAMIAYETGSTVTWDAATDRIVDNPSAAALLKRQYREPWKHPYQG
ncbi:MAG: Gfo/Idh/MocA family oxidoreductase [Thermoguttaceae bacterium]|jgi:predicted dehydrogenase